MEGPNQLAVPGKGEGVISLIAGGKTRPLEEGRPLPINFPNFKKGELLFHARMRGEDQGPPPLKKKLLSAQKRRGGKI